MFQTCMTSCSFPCNYKERGSSIFGELFKWKGVWNIFGWTIPLKSYSICNAKSKYQIWPSFPDPIVHNLALSPVIDGDFLPTEPDTLFGNAADIDYIAGVNDMDGHIFATLDIPSINNELVSTPV